MAYLGNKKILFSPEVTIITIDEGAKGYTLIETTPIIVAYTTEKLSSTTNEVDI